MTMNCRELRNTWQAGQTSQPKKLLTHLTVCDACAEYTRRIEVARQLFAAHQGNLEPDAGFVSRVVTHIPQDPIDVMGWAVARLLPATLLLVLILAWFALNAAPVITDVAESQAPTDDLLGWVTDQSEVEFEENQ
jgi:hypothetical protein